MSNKKVTKIFKLFITAKPRAIAERNGIRGLKYKVYYSKCFNSFDFQKFEAAQKTDDFFTAVDREYPFYANYEDSTSNVSLRITDSKPGNYIVNNLTNELPFTITKIVTDLKQKAVIEVEMDEETSDKYSFDLKETVLVVDVLEPNQAIESKVKSLMGFSFI